MLTRSPALPLAPWSLLLAVGALLAAAGCTRQAATPPPAVSEVVVTSPRSAEVPEYLEVTGRIDAELVVDIRSRITGYLTKVAFRDGQFVAKGDPLYEIDVRPYAAQLAAAAGTIDRLLGEERFLKVQVDRYEKLVAKGAASQQEFDSYNAKLDENEGSLAAARAQHEAARLNVEFCSIAAPITFADTHPDLIQIRYEDLVDGNLASLSETLGLSLGSQADVGPELQRVVRTRSYGNWADWFTEADIELFRPLLQPYLDRHYPEADWNLKSVPRIAPEHASRYVLRILSDRRRVLGLGPWPAGSDIAHYA